MAAPSFVGAGSGTVITTGSGTVSKTGCTVGNIIVVQVLQDGGEEVGGFTVGTISGIENLAGTDNTFTWLTSNTGTSIYAYAAIGRAISTSVSFGLNVGSDGFDLYARIYEFSGVITGTSVTDETSSMSGTAAQIDGPSLTTQGADRLCVALVYVNDDNAVGAFTGTTGATWAEATAEYATATGTDGCVQIQTATKTSAGTVSGGSYTMAAADSWITIAFALKPPASGPQTFYQTPAVTTTVTPAIQRNIAKTTAATTTTSPAVKRSITTTVAVATTITAAAAKGKFLTKLADATTTVTATVSRVIPKATAATTTITAAVARRINKATAAATTVGAAVVRRFDKTTAAATTVTAAAAAGKYFAKAADATTTVTAAATKAATRAMLAAATTTVTPSVTRLVSLAATASTTIGIASNRLIGHATAATSTITAAVGRRVDKFAAATTTVTATGIRGQLFKRTADAVTALTATGAARFTAIRNAAATTTVTPAVARQVGKIAAATTTVTVARVREIRLRTTVPVTYAPNVIRQFNRVAVAVTTTVEAAVTKAPALARVANAAVTLAVTGATKLLTGRKGDATTTVDAQTSHSVTYYQPPEATYRRWFDAALRQLRR